MAAGRCVVAQVKQFIAHQHAVFVSPKAIQEMGAELDRHPVGTGRFKFGEWQDDVKIVGERFDKWAWGPSYLPNQGPAYPDRMWSQIFGFNTTDNAQAFEAGAVSRNALEKLRESYNLDKSPPHQFVLHVWDVVRGVLGTSIAYGRPVVDIIASHWPQRSR